MDEFFDNGNIVLNISVHTDVNETLMQTYERIISTGDNLIFKSLEKILSGNKETIKNNAKDSSYFTFPSPYKIVLYRLKKLFKEIKKKYP